MVPPGIEPGSCPRQGHVLAVGLWDHKENQVSLYQTLLQESRFSLVYFPLRDKIFKLVHLIIFMIKRYTGLFFIIYLIFGLYFVNYAFNFIALPSFFAGINQWIILIGGILIILGGVNQIRLSKYTY